MVMFKYKKDFNRFLGLNPLALILLADMNYWCKLNNMPFRVTSTVSTKAEDKQLNRVSSTHREGRAFDVSVQDWTKKQTERFIYHFENKFALHAAKNKDGENRLIVRHVGTADHLHIQIHKSYNKFLGHETKFWEIENE